MRDGKLESSTGSYGFAVNDPNEKKKSHFNEGQYADILHPSDNMSKYYAYL